MADWPILSDGGACNTYGASASKGTTIPCGATPNTLTSWVQLGSSTVAGGVLTLWLEYYGSGGTGGDFLVDIGIGSTGNQVVLLSQLLFSSFSYNVNQACIPIYVPPNVNIWARAQCDVASRTMYIVASLTMPGFMPSSFYQRVTTYGINNANTPPGTLVDPGGTMYTKGAWTQIGGSTSNPIKLLLPAFGVPEWSSGVYYQGLVDIGVGPSSGSVTVIISNIQIVCNANAFITPLYPGPFPVNIPAGSGLWVRSQCGNNTATGRELQVGLYGID
jgi:hypothetical protein